MNQYRGAIAMVVVSAILPVGAAIAVADPVADPLPQEKETPSHYHVTLSMKKITIQSVPNMAAAPLVREGYITGTAELKADCTQNLDGSPTPSNGTGCPPILGSTLIVNAQIGCPMDLSDGIELNPNGLINASVPGTVLGQLLPTDPTDLTNIAFAPTVGAGLGQLKVDMAPGVINNVTLGIRSIPATPSEIGSLREAAALAEKVNENIAGKTDDELKKAGYGDVREQIGDVGDRLKAILNQDPKDGLVISMQNRHIVVQRNSQTTTAACGGPVAIRLYANGVVNTATSSDKVSVFSDIVSL